MIVFLAQHITEEMHGSKEIQEGKSIKAESRQEERSQEESR
jgi:hypothetical protein